MGLAASQARYLSLTARKSDLEYQSQTINTRRLQLAYKTQEVAAAYSEGMRNDAIAISLGNNKWEVATWDNLLEQDYLVIGTGGQALKQASPYLIANASKEYYATAENATEKLSPQEYAKKVASDPEGAKKYKQYFAPAISETAFNELSEAEKQDYKINYKKNPSYSTDNTAMNIQDMLERGVGSIVTKEFYDFLVKKYNFDPQVGMPSALFASAQEAYKNDTSGLNTNNVSGIQDSTPTVIDWRSDASNRFCSRTNTEDDEAVLAEYEAATAEIQAQDKKLEIEEKNIETQHKAIETEMENIKKVIQKNIEETFKIFS